MLRIVSDLSASSSSSARIIGVLLLVIILDLLPQYSSATGISSRSNYSRADFPSGFVFGASTSAYQVEGAASEDGRTPSIYDAYTHAGHVSGYTGDIASDEYHKYKEDVKLMVDTGLEAYRFSISWPRLIPNGKGTVNPKAVEYYNNLINELLSNGIQPHVTLLHWDLPQALEEEYGGWISRQIVKDFTAYADVCFREFGDRVLHWTTINEPNWMVFYCDDGRLGSCISKRDAYIGAHNLLLAHGSIVKLYRAKYKEKQHGFVGLNVMASWFVPETDTEEDLLAAQKAADFMVGWFVNPLVYGDYPDTMKKSAGNRLPSFSEHESKLVKNSFDFIGVNCYVAYNIKDHPNNFTSSLRNYVSDLAVVTTNQFVGGMIVQRVLEYFKEVYGNPPIFIHENGDQTEHDAQLNDISRVEYLDSAIGSLLDSVRNGSNVQGYFVWSFLDVFELADGYKNSYGLYYVDFYDPNRKRCPKLSAHWYSAFLKGNKTDSSGIIQQVSNSPLRCRCNEVSKPN